MLFLRLPIRVEHVLFSVGINASQFQLHYTRPIFKYSTAMIKKKKSRREKWQIKNSIHHKWVNYWRFLKRGHNVLNEYLSTPNQNAQKEDHLHLKRSYYQECWLLLVMTSTTRSGRIRTLPVEKVKALWERRGRTIP